ncbi:MAG: hypothetical protein DWH82_07485 [Planctomycetota bacterium]|nr:MAG: hypothetical protein DWH82_07485 [Planctomycetota bacterium]
MIQAIFSFAGFRVFAGLELWVSLVVLFLSVEPAVAQNNGLNQEKGMGQGKKGGGGPKHVFSGPAPAHLVDLILARPTD